MVEVAALSVPLESYVGHVMSEGLLPSTHSETYSHFPLTRKVNGTQYVPTTPFFPRTCSVNLMGVT